MDFDGTNTAVVFIDPQNDVLSEKGKNWGAVGASVTENRTVENWSASSRRRRRAATRSSSPRTTSIRPTRAGR